MRWSSGWTPCRRPSAASFSSAIQKQPSETPASGRRFPIGIGSQLPTKGPGLPTQSTIPTSSPIRLRGLVAPERRGISPVGKVNTKGRNKYAPHIRLHRGLTNSPAWKSLSCEARALLIAVWARHNGQNIGEIAYSHREARLELRVGNAKVQKALQQLQDRGFLIARTKGSFGLKKRHATEWEITEEPCDGMPAKKPYRNWPGIQTTVPKAGTDSSHSGNRGALILIAAALHGSQGGNWKA